MSKLALLVFSMALLFALPLTKADDECFSEGHTKVLELGQCVQTDNGYKIVLSDVSGSFNKTNNTMLLQAVFKVFDSSGLVETITLVPCTQQFCGAYYATRYNFSIDLINVFAGIGQTAYADVYVRSWTQYKEFMPIGGEASFPGLRVMLYDISGFPTNTYFPQATFRVYDSSGNLVKQFILQRGLAGQTQEIEDVTNGVLTHLLVAFAGIGQTAYANVGFKVVSATPTITPVPTATTVPCSNDVYAQCPDGFSYLKSSCVNGELHEVYYIVDPCLKHKTTTPPKPPEKQGKETFKLTLEEGWNMVSTPVSTIIPAEELPAFSPGAIITSTTCSPTKLWHYENGRYVSYGELTAGGKILGTGGFWVKTSEECKVELSAMYKNFGAFTLQPGWNQIGAFFEPTEFSSIETDCVVLSGPWRYNTLAKKYEKASVLEPGEGYFVKVASECVLGGSLPPVPPQ